ncbi:hypothetical protein MRQ36_11650 [Micromonospora sp. R77]|uniref:hypothetical protein n=1 Tax=Micromonospora sp. R77 TaxID=2925836 RepID=UPI001F60ABB0|nr:hypothetical protein [Micromonospora sp. R77]MCI4063195.1 hypothetical protein [Micromonospora sp. R77]
MGEQAVTGAGGTPAPERTPAAGDAAAATGSATGATSAGMTADGTPAAPADVSGAGMSADTTPPAAGATPEAGAAPGAAPAEGAAPAGAAPAGGTQERTADITPGPGGVMTDEVGVVTGELTLRTAYADGQVTLHVQYKDADEWYAVTGGKAALADPAGLDAVHGIAVALLHRPEG